MWKRCENIVPFVVVWVVVQVWRIGVDMEKIIYKLFV